LNVGFSISSIPSVSFILNNNKTKKERRMKITFIHVTLKIIVSSFIMLGCAGRAYASDLEREQGERLLNPKLPLSNLQKVYHFSFFEPPLKPLKSNIEPILRPVNIQALQERCQREVNEFGFQAPIRLYCLINLSSSECSFFASSRLEPFKLRRKNTLFLFLLEEQYENSQQKFLVQEEICPNRTTFCQVLVLQNASLDEAQAAKSHLLERYARYKAKIGNHPEYTKAFPGYAAYLKNSEAYAAKIKGKKVVFTSSNFPH
jgi:hypothetical protein